MSPSLSWAITGAATSSRSTKFSTCRGTSKKKKMAAGCWDILHVVLHVNFSTDFDPARHVLYNYNTKFSTGLFGHAADFEPWCSLSGRPNLTPEPVLNTSWTS